MVRDALSAEPLASVGYRTDHLLGHTEALSFGYNVGRKELARSRALLAMFAAVQAQAANNDQSTAGELQCQAQCFEAFMRRTRDLALNTMDPFC